MNNRIREIIEMRNQEPEDPFLWYLLGLEYVKQGDYIKAEETFDFLLRRFPDYLPSYYQAAHFYWEQGEFEKAKTTFVSGLHLAESLEEIKTLQELRNSYQNFQIDIGEM